eukprot:750576-Rhodomonas_salina.2
MAASPRLFASVWARSEGTIAECRIRVDSCSQTSTTPWAEDVTRYVSLVARQRATNGIFILSYPSPSGFEAPRGPQPCSRSEDFKPVVLRLVAATKL